MTVSIRHVRGEAVYKCSACNFEHMNQTWKTCPWCTLQKSPYAPRRKVEDELVRVAINTQSRIAELEIRELKDSGHVWFVLRQINGSLSLTVEIKPGVSATGISGYMRWPWKGSIGDATELKMKNFRNLPDTFVAAAAYIDQLIGAKK